MKLFLMTMILSLAVLGGDQDPESMSQRKRVDYYAKHTLGVTMKVEEGINALKQQRDKEAVQHRTQIDNDVLFDKNLTEPELQDLLMRMDYTKDGQDRKAIFDLIVSQTDAGALRSAQRRAVFAGSDAIVSQASSTLKIDSKAFKAMREDLAKLAEPMSDSEMAIFYTAFVKEILSDLEENVKQESEK